MIALLTLLGTAHAEDLLLVGNSYTFANDLEQRTREVFVAGAARGNIASTWAGGATQRLADGGLLFKDHLLRAQTNGSPWQQALAKPEARWDWIVFQEQSQVAGFPEEQSDVTQSRTSAAGLDDLAEARGAQTVWLLTWGRRDGDSTNRDRYPDYRTMQDYLTEGYRAYREGTSTEARPTWIAPAGPAFGIVHGDLIAAGSDPLAAGSRFAKLYVEDGSHPSAHGSYLTACVIYSTVTGDTCVGLPAPANVPSEDVGWLQDASWRAVNDNALGFSYPWTPPPDTGGSDTALDTASDTDASDTGASDTSDTSGAATKDDAGCGCATGVQVPAGALASFVGMLALVRNRRRTTRL